MENNERNTSLILCWKVWVCQFLSGDCSEFNLVYDEENFRKIYAYKLGF